MSQAAHYTDFKAGLACDPDVNPVELFVAMSLSIDSNLPSSMDS